jgi:hypothetical protein
MRPRKVECRGSLSTSQRVAMVTMTEIQTGHDQRIDDHIRPVAQPSPSCSRQKRREKGPTTRAVDWLSSNAYAQAFFGLLAGILLLLAVLR